MGLADQLSLELTSGGVELDVRSGAAPAGRANLAWRAAAGFLARWAPGRGVRIVLDKEIPMGGGLGGGSSNAGTVLAGLQEMLNRPAAPRDLQAMAGELGADVPYFLVGGTALGRGRGDELTVVEDLPERSICLATPPVEISTAQIFAELDLSRLERSRAGIEKELEGRLAWDVVDRGWNDLEQTVMRCYPVVRDVYNGLLEGGATLVRLSGTGATVFAFFRSPSEASAVASRLPEGSRVVHTKTLQRSAIDRLHAV